MSIIPTPQELAEALDNAGGLTITRLGHLTGRQVIVSAVWQGQPLQFQATITDVLQGELPARPRQRSETAHLSIPRNHSLFDDALTEAQCRQSGYPLYFAEDWLRAEFERLKSFAALSREYGYPETNLLHAARRFGWPLLKPGREEIKKKVQADWLSGQTNKSRLAKKYGVSVGSVFNWVNELKQIS